MKKINSIILFLLLLISIDGQEIENQIGESEHINITDWKEFVALDKSFKISFPKVPNIVTSKQFTFGKILDAKTSKRYISKSVEETFFVGFDDYPAPLKDELELKAKYQSMFLFSPDKEVFVQNHVGVEKIEEIDDALEIFNTYSVNAIYRVFIVKQRIFIIAAFTPTTYKLTYAQAQKKKKDFRQKADKFFKSFEVMKIPTAKNHPTPLLPKDYGINLLGSSFHSQKLNLKIQIPTNWSTWFYEPEDVETIDDVKGGYSGSNSYKSIHNKRNKERLFYSTSRGSTYWLTVYRREFNNTKVDSIANEMATLFKAESKIQKIKGRRYVVVEKEKYNNSLDVLQTSKQYFTEWNGYFLEIGISYINDENRRFLEKSVDSLSVLNKLL